MQPKKCLINKQHYNYLLMNFAAKKFLVVLEINNVMFYLNNPKSKLTSFNHKHVPVDYNDSYNNYDISVRKGKN